MREQGYYWVIYKCYGTPRQFIAFFAGNDWELNGDYLKDDDFDEIDEQRIVRGANTLTRTNDESMELYEFHKLKSVNGKAVREVAIYHNNGDSNGVWPTSLNLVSHTVKADK